MPPKKFTLPHGAVWKRPDEAYFDYKDQAAKLTSEEVEWNGTHKRIRELRDLAVFGLCMYETGGNPYFVQMNTLDDSPDAFIMQQAPDDPLTANIGPIELTFYGNSKKGRPEQTLLERLKAKGGKFQKLPEGYALVIHIGIGEKVDHEEIAQHLKAIDAKFQVFPYKRFQVAPTPLSVLWSMSLSASLLISISEQSAINFQGLAFMERLRKLGACHLLRLLLC